MLQQMWGTFMTMKRTGDAWMPADEYGRGLPRFSVNLLVRAPGTPLANTVVTFATQGIGYGVFFPSGGTALTNSSGVATITLNAGETQTVIKDFLK